MMLNNEEGDRVPSFVLTAYVQAVEEWYELVGGTIILRFDGFRNNILILSVIIVFQIPCSKSRSWV